MAVTAEDKKLLNSSQLAAVQKATNDWNKAQASGDKAGMAAAAAAASQARSQAGYTTNADGTYKAPVAQTTGSNRSTGGGTTTTQQSAPQRDIAAEIVTMLTSGGTIDYGRLNQLAAERDAKLKSDPTKYSQFESTQTIIDRYLPIAQQNATLQQQMAQQAQQPAQDVDSVISLLQNLAQSKNTYMSFDQAQNRAAAELNPMYQQASQQLTSALNADMEQRGIYNSPLASGIMTEKQGKLSNEQIAAIAQRANTLIQNDAELTLQEKQLKSSTLNSLLQSLIGRENNITQATGYYRGQPTLAQQQYEADKALKEGQLTGNYNGQQTLESQQLDITKMNAQIANALNSINTLGRVTTQEQADLLGVPVGTPSAQAQQAAQSMQQEMEMFNREMGLKQYSASLSARSNNAGTSMANFNKDMAIWEQTGVAPDTAALRAYGIMPGTPWNQSAKEKLEELQAQQELYDIEQELNFQKRVQNLQSYLGVSSAVAESAVLLFDQGETYERAKSLMNQNSSALKQEGVDLVSLDNVLKKHYGYVEKTKTKYTNTSLSDRWGYK